MAKRYWLFKSDPESFSFQDLQRAGKRATCWDGVRNYQARNLLRDEVAAGDGVLVHHSKDDPPAVLGTAVVVRAGYPDPTQFDSRSKYHDPKATPDAPRWFAVDLRADQAFAGPLSLKQLRGTRGLASMELLRTGSRLSIQRVTAAEWKIVLALGEPD